MSKKKEINLKSTPAAVESGDVNITYNNVLVGSLSESGSAVLKTEMTICEHDIELEYTKSGSDGPAGNIVNITNNSIATPRIEGPMITTDSVWINDSYRLNIPAGISKLYLYNTVEDGSYRAFFNIKAFSDIYSVAVNSTPITYGVGGYLFNQTSSDSPISGQTYNVIITDKE